MSEDSEEPSLPSESSDNESLNLDEEEIKAIRRFNMTPRDLERFRNKECFNCGQKGHYSKDCPKPHPVKPNKEYQKKAFFSNNLQKERSNRRDKQQIKASTEETMEEQQIKAIISINKSHLPIYIKGNDEEWYPAQALIDSGASKSYINPRVVQ